MSTLKVSGEFLTVWIELSGREGVPIYRQIVDQVKYQIASGRLREDEELPAIRQLAETLVVTPGTVAKAYRELELAGLVYKRQGAGTYVAGLSSPLALKQRREILQERIDALVVEARHLGFDQEAVTEMLKRRYSALEHEVAKGGKRA